MSRPSPPDGSQIEGDDVEARLVIHVEKDLSEGVDDEAVASVGEGRPPVATVDADDEKLVFQGPSHQQRSPEVNMGKAPGAGNEEDLGPSQGQGPNLFGKLGVEADEDACAAERKIDEPQGISGDEGMLFLELGMKVDFVVGQKHLSIGADDVAAVAVAPRRSDGQTSGDDGDRLSPRKFAQTGEDGLPLVEEGESPSQGDDGVPEFGKDDKVTLPSRKARQEIHRVLKVALGIGPLESELKQSDTKFRHGVSFPGPFAAPFAASGGDGEAKPPAKG